MRNRRNGKNRLFWKISVLCLISFVFLLSFVNILNTNQDNLFEDSDGKNSMDDLGLDIANSQEDILSEGQGLPLNITEYASLKSLDQDISVSNDGLTNLTYILDEDHDWKATEIINQLNNIEDEKDWIENGTLGTKEGPFSIFRNYTHLFDGNNKDADYFQD